MAAIKIVAQGIFGLFTTGVRTPTRAWFKCAVDIRLATFLFRFLPGLARVGDIRKGRVGPDHGPRNVEGFGSPSDPNLVHSYITDLNTVVHPDNVESPASFFEIGQILIHDLRVSIARHEVRHIDSAWIHLLNVGNLSSEHCQRADKRSTSAPNLTVVFKSCTTYWPTQTGIPPPLGP